MQNKKDFLHWYDTGFPAAPLNSMIIIESNDFSRTIM